MATPTKGYHGPLVVLTPAETARVFGWARADQHADDTTIAVREKCKQSIESDVRWRQPL